MDRRQRNLGRVPSYEIKKTRKIKKCPIYVYNNFWFIIIYKNFIHIILKYKKQHNSLHMGTRLILYWKCLQYNDWIEAALSSSVAFSLTLTFMWIAIIALSPQDKSLFNCYCFITFKGWYNFSWLLNRFFLIKLSTTQTIQFCRNIWKNTLT